MKISIQAYLCFLLLTIIVSACRQDASMPLYLQGKWKVQDQNTYEEWQIENDTLMTGKGFKIIDGTEIIKEILSIKYSNKTLIYSATVPDQNEGQTIQFKNQNSNPDNLIFENKNHDFPKKITYTKTSQESMTVNIQGDDGGFKIIMEKIN